MSDTIPRLRKGDKVRIMQTDEMVRRGLANYCGTIYEVDHQNCVVTLRSNGRQQEVPASSLMQIEAFGIGR